MLRPILMVTAFFFAGSIVVMGGTLLNATIIPAIANIQSNSTTGIISIIGFLGIYVVACVTLIHNSFNLIYILPDKVMEWIGGSQLASGHGSEQQLDSAVRTIAGLFKSQGGNGKGSPTPDKQPKNSSNSIKKRG